MERFIPVKKEDSVPIAEAIQAQAKNKQKANDSEIVKHIIKYSPHPLMTKEIIEQYAERVNSSFALVRPFVDATLSRLVKEEVIDRVQNESGRGSKYVFIEDKKPD